MMGRIHEKFQFRHNLVFLKVKIQGREKWIIGWNKKWNKNRPKNLVKLSKNIHMLYLQGAQRSLSKVPKGLQAL